MKKTQAIKENKLITYFIKIKIFFERHILKNQNISQKLRKIFIRHIGENLIHKITKNSYESVMKGQVSHFKKWAKDMNRHLNKRSLIFLLAKSDRGGPTFHLRTG